MGKYYKMRIGDRINHFCWQNLSLWVTKQDLANNKKALVDSDAENVLHGWRQSGNLLSHSGKKEESHTNAAVLMTFLESSPMLYHPPIPTKMCVPFSRGKFCVLTPPLLLFIADYYYAHSFLIAANQPCSVDATIKLSVSISNI